MFVSLFQNPTVLARHRDGPSADERQRFLVHRAHEGAAHGTLLRIARELLVIAKLINTTGQAIARRDLEIAADKWARHQQRRGRSHRAGWSRELFLQVGKDWLRFLGRWQERE